ncbi:hypothetical protein PY254_01195 [Rhodanobacter sp. AS-Z3]|uniref:DUF7010 family protein n=1 Tax=Rhodanobacter sp. AS-Z3 TaxID=3031330 RepID=UPI00247A493E|nr:hypothetical protein [Rhodanobacter sp. AS-Z3]WEN15325.1 hypothetical protein PY254_01195 [Rhodanobacter sp. AS-Z3]
MSRNVEGLTRSLDQQREEFARRRLLAMPLAGCVAWLVAGVAGACLSPLYAVWALFIATGCIAYLGIFLSRFTGENFLDKSRPKNAFDSLFMLTVLMSVLVYAIALPFFLRDYSSLPLSVGILTGLMWLPVSWIIRHWIGIAHAVGRTVLVLAAWYLFPTQRFVVIPAVIVVIYVFTIMVLESRWRAIHSS